MRTNEGDSPVQVRAAGGVVLGPNREDRPRVAVVHRPRYRDWTLPKGKLDPGEGWEEAALREVEEETGLRCRPLTEIDSVRYADRKGRSKLVRYWLMEPVEGEFAPNDEVDQLRWCDLGEAEQLLSYPHDLALVRRAFAAARDLKSPSEEDSSLN
jgi:8-oxo-dGTP diphosphatase